MPLNEQIDTRAARIAAVTIFLLGLTIVCIGFATLDPNPAVNRYPGTEDILENTNAYVGDRVAVVGTVVQTEPLVIVDDYSRVRDGRVVSGTIRYTITDTQTNPNEGDSVQVFGTLTDSRTVQAANTVAVPAGNYRYMYAVSALAGLWVLTRVLRQWRLDWTRFALAPRSTRLDLRSTLTALIHKDEEDSDDA